MPRSNRITVKAYRRLIKDSNGYRRWEHFPRKAVLREAGFTSSFAFNLINVNFEDYDRAVGRVFELIQAVTHRSYEDEAEKVVNA